MALAVHARAISRRSGIPEESVAAAGAAIGEVEPEVPARIDDYVLRAPLGRGGMGTVWLAWDERLLREVAIKFPSWRTGEDEERQRFLVEARAVARLSHPNVVAIHRTGEVEGRPYLVTERLRGQSLRELPKPVPWRRALAIGLGLSRGLAAAHGRGLLHRDIKPANAMLTDEGVVKLLDFGLAKRLDAGEAAEADPSLSLSPALTRRGTVVGTPLYMAPEVRRSLPATRESDVCGSVGWSALLGFTLHRNRLTCRKRNQFFAWSTLPTQNVLEDSISIMTKLISVLLS